MKNSILNGINVVLPCPGVFETGSINWVGLCLRVSIGIKLHDPVSIAAWMKRDPGSCQGILNATGWMEMFRQLGATGILSVIA